MREVALQIKIFDFTVIAEEKIDIEYFERKFTEAKKYIPVRQRITEQRGKCMTNEINNF